MQKWPTVYVAACLLFWLLSFLPHVNLEVQSPPPPTHANSVDKNSIICLVYSGCKHTESHMLLCLPSACFCEWSVNFGQLGRFFFCRLAENSGVRRSGSEPPSHNSCSVIVASGKSADFGEGTVEKYTSFSKLAAWAAGTPKNRGSNWLSSCHC